MNEQPSASRAPIGNDNDEENKPASLLSDIAMGIRFYSRIPLPGAHSAPQINRLAPALPFASLAIGFVPALALFLALMAGLPPLYAAGLAVALQAIITGAMTEDGIADSADALFGGTTIEQRLEIFKDSRHGTYGVSALVLFLFLRVIAIASLATVNPFLTALAWLGVMAMSRSGALWLIFQLPPARPDGASASIGRITRLPFLIGGALAALVGFVLTAPAVGTLRFTLALGLCTLVAYGWTRLCRRLLSGQTGDVIGALQGLLEIAALTAFIAF